MQQHVRDFINRGVVPLVGRDGEIRSLTEAFSDLLEGEARALWMTGPPGVGKSRLLDELKGIVREHAARALVVHAKWYEGEGVEFGPLSNALDVLRSVVPASVAPRIFRDGTVVSGDAAVEAVQIASRRYPVILILDDLHYLASGRDVGRFVAALEEIPVLVIVTSRPGESEALTSIRMALSRAIPPQELAIEPLEGSGIVEAVRKIFDVDPPDEMLEQIAALSGGVPLALRETLRELIAAGHVALGEDGVWIWRATSLSDGELKEIGDRIHGFSGRLASLPQIERELLSLAAFLGEQFNRDLLRRVAERTTGWDDQAFERLIVGGLVAVASPSIRLGLDEPDDRSCYAFTHTLLWKGASVLRLAELPPVNELAAATLDHLTRGVGELYGVSALESVDLPKLESAVVRRTFDWLVSIARRLPAIYSETFATLCGSLLDRHRSGNVAKGLEGEELLRYLAALSVYGERLYLAGGAAKLGEVAADLRAILDRCAGAPRDVEERVARLDAAVVVWHEALMRGEPEGAEGYLDQMLDFLPPPAEQTDRELRGAAEAIRLLASYSFQRGQFAEMLDVATPYLAELDRMTPETLNAFMKVMLYAMLNAQRVDEARVMVEAGLRARHQADLFTAYELLMHAANYARNAGDLDALRAHAHEMCSLVDRYPPYRGLSTNFWYLPFIHAADGDAERLAALNAHFDATPVPARSTPVQTELAKLRFFEAWNLLSIPDRARSVAAKINDSVFLPYQRDLILKYRLRTCIDARDAAEGRRLLNAIERLHEEHPTQNRRLDEERRLAMLLDAVEERGEELLRCIGAGEGIDFDHDWWRAGRLLLEIGERSPGMKREYSDAGYTAIERAIELARKEGGFGLAHHQLDLMSEILPKTRLQRFRKSAGDDPRGNDERESDGESTSTGAREGEGNAVLRTFGALRLEGISDGGAKIESKTRLLVAALVVSKLGEVRWMGDLTRDRLADLLWPDMSGDRAVNNLHATVSYARRFLGGSQTIAQIDGVYSLAGGLTIDAVEFRECIRKGHRLHDEGIYFGAAAAYRSAVEWAEGDFLEGMYADWIDAARENLRGEMATALERLVEIELSRENYAAIPHLAERLLALDDLHDGAYEALIRSAAVRGARREAFTYYKRYEKALEEYGAGPVRRIADLVERVRAGEEV